jgi:hypothetical protein
VAAALFSYKPSRDRSRRPGAGGRDDATRYLADLDEKAKRPVKGFA